MAANFKYADPLNPTADELMDELEAWVPEQEAADARARTAAAALPATARSASTAPSSTPSSEQTTITPGTTPLASAAGAASPPASAIPYSFPVDLATLEEPAEEQGQLVGALDRLVRAHVSTRKRVPYVDVREQYCLLQAQLNLKGLSPPSLRPRYKRPPTAAGHDWNQLSRDTQVIDLHWLHCTGFRGEMMDLHYHDVLAGDELGQSEVESLVAENWGVAARIERLNFNEFVQWQMATLRGPDARHRVDALLDQERRVHRALQQLVHSGARLNAEDAIGFAQLWFARELTGAGASLDAIARVYGWRRGLPAPTRPTISTRLRRMAVWLKKAGV